MAVFICVWAPDGSGGVMKSLWALAVAFFVLTLPGAADEVLLTTFYPPPNGEYLNLNILGTLTGNSIAMTGNIVGAWLAASSSNPSITLNRSGTVNFSVQAAGNTVVGGTLVAGNTNGTGIFSITGNVSIGGNLDMTSGAISNVTTLATSGNASLGGFTTVGNTIIGGNLDMTSGAISNVTTLATSGNASLGGFTTVGNTTIGGNLDMTSGAISNVTTLTTSGNASLGGFTTVGNTTIGGNLDMTSGAISNVTTLGTSGNVSIGGNLDMTSGPVSNVTTVSATGKMYSQTTTSSDASNTVVTKNYVDAMAGGGAAYKVYGGFMTAIREDGSGTRREYVWGAGTSSGTCTKGAPRRIAQLQDLRSSAEWGGSGSPPSVHGDVYLCVQ